MHIVDNSAYLVSVIDKRKTKEVNELKKAHKDRMDTLFADIEKEYASKREAAQREHDETLASETKRIQSHYGLIQEHKLLKDQEDIIDAILQSVDRKLAAKQIMDRLKKEKCTAIKQSGQLISASQGKNTLEVDVEREIENLRPKVLEMLQ